MVRYDEIPGWCAGLKVSGVRGHIVDELEFDKIEWEVARSGESVIVISVNEEETSVIEWCKKHKFKKTAMFKNYYHNDRRTFLFMKQVRKDVWKEAQNYAVFA